MADQLLVTRETLAKILDIRNPSFVDQLVKRGILPEPVDLGGQPRWRTSEVEARISGLGHVVLGNCPDRPHDEGVDPYLAGVADASKAAAPRSSRQKPGRANVSVLSPESGNVTPIRPDPAP